MRYRQGESRRDSFGVRKEKENEPWVLRFSTLCLRISECRNARAEREREVATRKPWGEPLKCGREGGVIRGSFALEFGRERKAMVRNGECGAEQETRTHLARGGLNL